MRTLPLLLVALLIIPMVPAQTMVSGPHEIRIAYGDIPSTEREEPEGRWNVQQTLRIPQDGNATFTVPDSHDLDRILCDDDCTYRSTKNEDSWTIECVRGLPDDVCTIRVRHWGDGSLDAYGFSMYAHGNTTILTYTVDGLAVESGTDNLVGDGFYYPGSDPALLIHQFNVQDGRFWFTVSPAPDPQTVVEEPTTVGASGWIWGILIGLIVGAGAWFVLVQQGIVQKRQRKQVAGEAAHKTVAAKENKATLEWRRRALLAAMKELEVARMDQTIDLEAYDALKADFKKQTVTVMRALEELGD